MCCCTIEVPQRTAATQSPPLAANFTLKALKQKIHDIIAKLIRGQEERKRVLFVLEWLDWELVSEYKVHHDEALAAFQNLRLSLGKLGH